MQARCSPSTKGSTSSRRRRTTSIPSLSTSSPRANPQLRAAARTPLAGAASRLTTRTRATRTTRTAQATSIIPALCQTRASRAGAAPHAQGPITVRPLGLPGAFVSGSVACAPPRQSLTPARRFFSPALLHTTTAPSPALISRAESLFLGAGTSATGRPAPATTEPPAETRPSVSPPRQRAREPGRATSITGCPYDSGGQGRQRRELPAHMLPHLLLRRRLRRRVDLLRRPICRSVCDASAPYFCKIRSSSGCGGRLQCICRLPAAACLVRLMLSLTSPLFPRRPAAGFCDNGGSCNTHHAGPEPPASPATSTAPPTAAAASP